ncbi:MAG TPA: beta-N-acetylhexosaminidase, partial [Chitinophagaceae bacterium]|nr:beta-N-acetylhexosaminidase [Chitinophagaceae bacterium]
MKQTCFFFLLCISLAAYSQSPDGIAIIPQPVSLQKQQGSFVLPQQLIIQVGKNPEVKQIGTRLAERISMATGYKVTIDENTGGTNGISLVLASKSFPKEGYSLDVKPSSITLEAAEPSGIFYGVQTLLQLLPKEIESKSNIKKDKWEIPAVVITDHPRFGWRGLMLDVSRHFFTKEQVKEFIDDMVKYKYNLL